ncbi:hypothetical protein D9M73_199700 [compost metagenome]
MQRTLGDLVPQAVQVAHSHAVQHMAQVSRQYVLEALNVAADVQLTAFDALIQRRAFLHQQRADDDYRHNRDDNAQQQGNESSQITPEIQAHEQAALQGCEEYAEDYRPEDCAVEWN